MCGISAVYRYSKITDADTEKLHLMNEEMAYRGPDERGIWFDDLCGLAQVRLSIIGIEKGKQPLLNEDKSLVLICNGEIYNYIELKKELLSKGHQFSSDSDSETILHLYEESGEKCLLRLRGQYSFCLYDTKKRLLFAARDRIGEKTLYYAQIPEGVVFSTELKAILKYYIKTPQINLRQLAAPIRYTCPVSKSDTWIEQIKRVEPGQYLLANENGIRKYHYWKRNTETTFTGTIEEAIVRTLALMRESIDISLRSDVPIAVMLSGGIDSTAIATLAKETGREVHTITAGYKGQHDCDEREVAKRFAAEKGLIYHEIELDQTDFKDCFEEFTFHIDEPITDGAALAQWALYRKVKNLGFKVLLGGIGGDELFFGYPYWNKFAESLATRRQHEDLFPWNTFDKKISYIKFLIKEWKYIFYAGYPYKIADSSIMPWQLVDYYQFVRDAKFIFDETEYNFSDYNPYMSFGNCDVGKEPDLVYNFCFENVMTLAYLYLGDRLGMGNSIEIRSPLLDYKLVEFISGLPLTMKYKPNQPKFFLKEVLQGIIPNYILQAKKKGFEPPNSFINGVTDSYQYRFFSANHKYYNSVLADRVVSLTLKY
mgnify:CR=1 FL=1